MLERNDWVFMDCEAGLEHLGRATSRAADALLVVVEPSHSSLETGLRIRQLAAEIGLTRLYVVGNKVRDAEERELIEKTMADMKVLACLPDSLALRQASRRGIQVRDPEMSAIIAGILDGIAAGNLE